MHSAQRSLLLTRHVDFDAIMRTERRIGQAKKAPKTREAYFFAWRAFCLWCDAADLSALPADPRAVQNFTTWCLNEGYKLNTVCLRLSGIAHYHREAGFASPLDGEVRRHISNAKRHFKELPGGKRAVTGDMLRRIMSRSSTTVAGVRNRAMILLTFAAGWRRSETTFLQYSDFRFVSCGIELWLRSSKTDQTGEGRLVGIQPGDNPLTCPVLAMRAWFAIRGTWDGPLFPRITPQQQVSREPLCSRAVAIHLALRRSLEQIGEEANYFGAHSLRAGMITEAVKNGASEAAIMQRTGHRNSRMLQRYIRPATAFDFNPLKGVL